NSYDTQSFSLTVNNKNQAPNIDSSPPTSANEGSSYSYSIDASDPDGDELAYSLNEGPSWLSLSGNILSGTPGNNAAGSHNIEIEVSDGNGGTDTQSYTLDVSNTNRSPSIDSSPPTSATEGSNYSYSIEASDPDGDDLTYSLDSGPGWLSLSGSTLSGSPG